MIRHARVSGALKFKEAIFRRWGFMEATAGYPVVMFGMYNQRDVDFFNNHKSHVTVVWSGSDASKDHRLERDARHIAKSSCVQKRLKKKGIESEIIPITGTQPETDIHPMGDKIYHYGRGKKYGEQYIDEIEKITGIEVVRTRWGMYKDIKSIYRQCFIGLRLTPRDGLPNTVVELGLMGRRCVFNGDLPGSIPWEGIDDICNAIRNEYVRRHEDNSEVANNMCDFIDISDNWLKI